MQVIGEAGDGKAAIDRVRELSPDVVVMDITMPNFNGIDATRQIVSESPSTRVVALSIHSGKRFVEDMLGAGAAGYILKLSAPEELVAGIRAVMQGEVYLSAGITGVVVSQYLKILSGVQDSGKTTELTPKESETLQLMAEGRSTKQIATVFQIRQKTVQVRQRRVMEKLEVSDIDEIAEVARQKGLLDVREASVPAHENGDLTVLHTKLQRPLLPPDVVPREHLVARIDELLSRPVTLVSAAAGYGKSTMASLWLEAWDGRSAWVSLDEEENDLRLFLAHLLAAIRSMFPTACDTTQSLLQSPGLPPVSVLSRYLLNDLVEIKDRFILVLDDYHRIREKRVHDLMVALLAHPPRNMHLILLTRRDPPVFNIKLLGRDQMTVIGISELRFRVDETADFLKKATNISIDDTSTATIHNKIEGWPTGMRLISQSLKHQGSVDHLLKGLSGGFGSIVDYLVSEVISLQSPEMANLMMETAILDRFCAPLCDALQGSKARQGMDEIDGVKFIDRLQKDNLFLIALDMENCWFRFHHLFQQMLKDQLNRRRSPEEIAGIHSRASDWFGLNGLIDESITHALAAGDAPAAARIVERNRHAALDADIWPTLQKWLERLPHDVKQARPDLLMGHAWVLLMSARVAEIFPIVERVESLLDEDSTEPARLLLSEINFFQGILCYFQGEGARSVELFSKAAELVPEGAFVELRSEVEYWTCVALHLDGRKQTGIRRLRDGIHGRDSLEGIFLSRLTFGLCFIHMLDGECLQAFQQGLRLREVSRPYPNVFAETWGMYAQGNASFQMFDLDAARHHLGLVAENRYWANPRAAVDAMAGLAITCQFMGKPDEADEAMKLAKEYAQWTKNPGHLEVVRSSLARLALLREDLDSALRWQRSLSETSGNPLMLFFLEISVITECRVLIANGSDAGLKKAIERLEDLRQKSKTWHNTCQTTEIMVLQALAIHRQGRLEEALDVLEQAVALAEPGGSIRPFVEIGRPMIDLLKRLAEKNVAVDYVGKLLAAFPDTASIPPQTDFRFKNNELRLESEALTQIHNQKSKIENSLIEPLTNRELDVLELLAQRMQRKEIAEKLFISIETVKTHVTSIYQKLNVSNRREAVEKAKILDILTRR